MALLPPLAGRAGVVLAILASVVVVRWLDRRSDWGRTRRSRLLLGVPWGTIVSILIVLSVYLFVQDGLDHWFDPVVVPFRSWSYFYPLGIVTSAFAHNGPNHLIGNLVSTVVLGSLAEYAWGHFPKARGTTTFSGTLTNPFVRAFVVVPGVVMFVGLVTGVFSLGPVVGFSGVVFAFAGFVLIRYPLLTVVALSADDAVRLVYRSLNHPVITGKATSRFIEPWWAGIAIQGHLLGLLVGVSLGMLVFTRRGERPSPRRLWVGGMLVTISTNLWAVWWFHGNNEFVLYRVVGLWLVTGLVLIVVVTVTASDREFPQWITTRRTATGVLSVLLIGRIALWAFGIGPDLLAVTIPTPVGRLPAVDVALGGAGVLLGVAILLGDDPVFEGASRRDVARLALVLPLVFTAAVAVPTSLATVDDPTPPGEVAIDVRDYTVTYAENVTSEMVSVVNVSAFGETTAVRTSGVIVISESRHLWATMASTSRLKFAGRLRVTVGGVGWRETVAAEREGWSVVGGPAVYAVWLKPPGERWKLAYTSDPAFAGPVLAGYRVALTSGQSGFGIALVRNGSVKASAPMPTRNASVTLEGIEFAHEGSRLIARYDGTRIEIASEESYKRK